MAIGSLHKKNKQLWCCEVSNFKNKAQAILSVTEMNFLTLGVIFLYFCKFVTSTEDFKSNKLQKAFVKISETLSNQNRLVSLVLGTTDVSNSVLSSSLAGIPHNVLRIDIKHGNFSLTGSAVVLLDSIESLAKFNELKILPATFPMAYQLFIYCRNGSHDEIARINTSKRQTPIIQYEYFVIEEEKSIRLLTFVWYSLRKCNTSQLIEVNRFDKTSERWQNKDFKIDKFTTFFGCRINFLFKGGMPEFASIAIDYENKAISDCQGYICNIVKDFSLPLNYTYHMNMHNSTHPLWPEIPTDVYIRESTLNLKFVADSNYKTLATRPIYHLNQYITVTPGEEFDGYEKLVLPFDENTWIWIGITFASAFVTIFVLKFVEPSMKNFVVGRGVEEPGLNVFRAFFGLSQVVCPEKNFARYLLMMFILFSLIIRTAYQGKMFEFLQKEMRKPTLATIEEMIEQNFTFYMQWNFKKYFKELDLVQRYLNSIFGYSEPNIFFQQGSC